MRTADELPLVVATAPPSRRMPRSLPCRSPSCPKSRFLRPYARRPRPVPISDSVMSSKFCCDSQRNGGPIVAGPSAPLILRFSAAQRLLTWEVRHRPNMRCLSHGFHDLKPLLTAALDSSQLSPV